MMVGIEAQDRKTNKLCQKIHTIHLQPTMKQLSKPDEKTIISLLRSGKSGREIHKLTGFGVGTISAIRKKHCSDLPKSSGGRPSVLSAHEARLIVRSITSGKIDTAPQARKVLQDSTNKTVSASTIRRSLKQTGMKSKVKTKKPLLTKKQERRRLQWAESHAEWTEDDWKRVIWSDETKINRYGSDGRQWTWAMEGEQLSSRLIKKTVKYGGGSVMVWGCMSWNGVGRLEKVEGKMNADQYVRILDKNLQPSIRELGMRRTKPIFQQDNDPKHTSKKAQNWFQNSGIEVMEWPAQSPDLNPIEHLWQHVKRKLAEYETTPTSVDQLWTRVQEVWDRIEPEECQRLIRSMPRRIEAVVKAKGSNTKY